MGGGGRAAEGAAEAGASGAAGGAGRGSASGCAGEKNQADPSKGYWQSLTRKPEAAQDEASLRAKVRSKLAAQQQPNARDETPIAASPLPDMQRQTAGRRAPEAEPPPAPLLPAWRDPAGLGRDSLGRGLDAGSIAAAVAGDGAVRREREAHGHYLQGTYREPLAARAALHELVKQERRTAAGA